MPCAYLLSFLDSPALMHTIRVWRWCHWKVRLRYLGKETIFFSHIIIQSPSQVSIGSGCSIADFVHLWGAGSITIGDNVLIASHVAITSLTHDVLSVKYCESLLMKPVKIGNNVWLGSGVVILPGIQVGDGAIVGAGSVVTKNVYPGEIVAGVPARVLKKQR